MSAWPQHSDERGFTLVELLLGLALLGVTLAIAFAALNFSGRSLERTDALVQELEEVRVAGSVVQALLGQALPLMQETQQRQVVFRGESQAVEFVAPAPSQQGRLAGVYHYRFRFVSDPQGTRLVLEHQPYVPGNRLDWSEDHATTDLLHGLVGGSFSYFGQGPAQHSEDWVEQWSEAESLPSLLRMQLARAPGEPMWPDRIVSLYAARGHR